LRKATCPVCGKPAFRRQDVGTLFFMKDQTGRKRKKSGSF
jgi:uncharacterized Zn finger protein (UPF0148 family)